MVLFVFNFIFSPKDIRVNTQRWQRFYFDIHLLWILNVLYYNYFYSNSKGSALTATDSKKDMLWQAYHFQPLSFVSPWVSSIKHYSFETLVVFLSSLVSSISNISATIASLAAFLSSLLFLQSFSLDHFIKLPLFLLYDIQSSDNKMINILLVLNGSSQPQSGKCNHKIIHLFSFSFLKSLLIYFP